MLIKKATGRSTDIPKTIKPDQVIEHRKDNYVKVNFSTLKEICFN